MISNSIIPGIKVLSDYDINNRVFLSSGTYWEVYDFSINENKSQSRFQGYIPKGDWRNCNQIETQHLFSKSKSLNHSQYIRISKIPYELFNNKEILRLNDKERFSIQLRELFVQEITFKIEQYFYKKFLKKSPAYSLGLRFIDNINLPTITFDENSNLFIGLHIDCWDNANSYQDEKYLRNRVCINLGQSPRCFLFINLTLKQLMQCLKYIDKIEELKNAIAQNFCKFFPNYPVVKIVLLPGEYYVAPTESIIHDATIP
ncbi:MULTISPECIES: hypothetical protein [unclassified Rickettsia]|uniref:hypothetical protein n=1 Tax=unclassified Rickettsia TaxID=114295 RepID=UPI0031332962